MAEDQCLIQYVRDNFGHEFAYNFVNMGVADDADDLGYNAFTESSPFTDADDPSSPVTTLAANLFVSPPSPSLSTDQLPSAAEEPPYRPPAATACISSQSGAVPPASSIPKLAIDTRPLLSEKDYPMLASYGFTQPAADHGQQPHGDCGVLTLDELLEEQLAAHSGISCRTTSGEWERDTSFWRGKTPALLMQQLKGPSLSGSSSSSEARSNLRSPPIFPSPVAQGPLNLTSGSWSNRLGGLKSTSFGAGGVGESVSNTGPEAFVSRQRSLPSLVGDHSSVDVRLKSTLSLGRSISPGYCRGVQHNSGSVHGDPGGDLAVQSKNMKQQRRKMIPGLAVFGDTQFQRSNATSGNNSWSTSSSTSPGPASYNVGVSELENEARGANFDLMRQKYSCSSSMGGERLWKKAKPGEFPLQGCGVSEDAVQAAILATAMVEQKEKNQLREKFLALLQIDASTSKDYKAQILDDTIRYLKDLRRRLNFNEADSTPSSKWIADSGFQTYECDEASPTTSSRCRPCGEGLSSPVRLTDLQLETAGVEISPHLTVDSGPHIEVRTMENQHLMVKLTTKDRPGLFNDIVVTLHRLRLDIQHANIRTGNNGHRNDIFAAKMQLPFFSSHSTHSIAMALNHVISARASPDPYTPQVCN